MSVTTELVFSYEYALDINLGTVAEPDWQQIRFSSAIDPQVTPVQQDGATYDDDGAPHPHKLSESWTCGATIQAHRLVDGAFLPEVEKLLELAGPESTGNRAVAHVRWYDDPVGQEPNPAEAYEGFAFVQMNRQNTGNDQIAGWTLTLTGQGRRRRIANPSTASLADTGEAPLLVSALPSGAAQGELVTITGAGLAGVTGAGGVKFGSTNATEYTVVSGTKIVAVVPAGSAGSAAITVTHPVNGASDPLAYTRGS